MFDSLFSQFRTIWRILLHTFTRAETVQYPEQKPYLAPRYGEERCVACNLCAVACPVDCIALQQGVREDGRWYPEFFRINFSRCIMCGMCEEACPTNAIQLTPDFEMCEYQRQDMVYEKEHLQIAGTGKYHDYNFYRICGMQIAGKDKGDARKEAPPIDVKSLLP